MVGTSHSWGVGAGTTPTPNPLRGLRAIKVDHPASQASKRERVRRLLGREPEHVTYVEVDFTRDDLAAKLAADGHERSARTLFIWSGVSPYLPEAAVAEVLTWVGAHDSPDASIVFDACWAEAVDGSREYYGAAKMRKAVAQAGEPLRWGIPEGRVRETLARFGLAAERTLDGEQARAAYLKRPDGTLHDRPYGFVVLVHARAGQHDAVGRDPQARQGAAA